MSRLERDTPLGGPPGGQPSDCPAPEILDSTAPGRAAEVDIAHLFDGGNNLRAPADMPDAARRLLAGIEEDATAEGPFVRKVRFIDRLKVLELIGKHIAVSTFRENVNHGVSDDLLERMEKGARRRATQR